MSNSHCNTGIVLSAVFLFSLAVAWFYALPYMALKGMQEAAAQNDSTRFAAFVDLPLVKASLKESVSTAITAVVADKDMSPYSTLGAGLAATLANSIVDLYATPEGLMKLVRAGAPENAKQLAPQGRKAEQNAGVDVEWRYLRFDEFAVDVRPNGTNQKPVVFVLSRDGLFVWRLTAIRVPLDQFAASANGFLLPGGVPKHTGEVVDLGSMLPVSDSQKLSEVLRKFESETTHKIAVLTVPSLAGESIEAYSLRVANAWALGRTGVDNGILVVLAKEEKQIRIELGRGFEPYISDTDALEIISTRMSPAFRQGDYAAGLERGITQLMIEARRLKVI